jgi:polysaccharide export outer membrane protein
VSIEFLNFKYTVLGAAGAGTYNVEGDRITLLEAIAKAGDLAENARINRVQVIREENGVRKVYNHDLRSKEIFDSPAYYLQQNDIVYVEPKYKKKDTEDRTIQYSSLLLSILSTVCSVLWWLN